MDPGVVSATSAAWDSIAETGGGGDRTGDEEAVADLDDLVRGFVSRCRG